MAPALAEAQADTPRPAEAAAVEFKQLLEQARAAEKAGDLTRAIGLYGEALSAAEKTQGAEHPNAATLLNSLGNLHVRAGEPGKALPLYQRSLAIYEKSLGAEHPAVAVSLTNIGNLYLRIGENAKALPLFQRSLEIRTKSFGPEHASTGASRNALAGTLEGLGRFNEALPLREQSAALDEKMHGSAHPATAASLNNLANVQRELGHFPAALKLFERSLAIREKALGPDHPETANSLNNLASVYEALGEPMRALPLYERSLAINEKALGGNHLVVATSLNNVASLYGSLGHYARAFPLYYRSLAIREKVLGPQHVEVALSLNNMASLYEAAGESARARAFYERSLAIYERTVGPEHHLTATALGNLASLHENAGDYAKALPLYERSLAIREKTRGPRHPATATSLNSLGLLYWRMGDYAKALPLNLRSLSIREEVLGPEHPETANSLNNLGLIYWRMQEQEKALPLFERNLAIVEKTLGPDRARTASALNNLAVVHMDLRQHDRALPLFERALAITERVYGPEHATVALRVNNVAFMYQRMGQPAKALPFAQRSLAIHEKTLGAEHPLTGGSLKNLGRAYRDLDRPELGLVLYHRALAVAYHRNDPELLWRTLEEMSVLLARQKRFELAIFYGKQAVNAIQELRAGIQVLDRDLQRSFLRDKTDAYRGLADLLIAQGRIAEAQQVLNMLKEEEFFEFVRGGAGESTQQSRIEFVAHERVWHERLQRITGQLARIGAARNAIERDARLGLKEADAAAAATLEQEKVAAVVELAGFHREVEAFFAQLKDAPQQGNDAVAQLKALQATLRDLGAGAVVVHYIQAETRINIIVTTATSQVARSASVSSAELNRRVRFFQTALRNPRIAAVAQAQALYKVLIGPIAEDLARAEARTLMVSLDGSLRYIPVGALHDGTQFLVERYDLALYTEVTKENLRHRPAAERSIAGLGLTRQIEDFSPLPAVKGELQAIVKSGGEGLIPGEMYFDESFSAANVHAALSRGHPLMHIASHFVFRPGNEASSFLLLGDGDKLTLSRIRADKFDFSRVDLVTLSACETGLGGGSGAQGEEVEGLGALVQKQGAKGVIATLWPVADESTGLLMQHFYRLRDAETLSKAAALRQAQLRLIRGEPAGTPRYAHPFYWAPFILMGNWL